MALRPPAKTAWAKRYPSFALFGIAIFLIAAVLPSALNLPLANPSQTLEYAPVAPTDENAPPGGNLSTLGLGSSGGLGSSRFLPEEALDQLGLAQGRRPSQKRCVGNPPRQTEDPLAPPCVAFFEGNNFGATHQGVTAQEVRVLFYASGYCDEGEDCSRTVNAYIDLAQPLTNQDDGEAHVLQALQKYFNDRFQTYGRFVHFFMYFEDDDYYSTGGPSPESRRADAAENFQKIKPYAVVTGIYWHQQAYIEAMASKGVVNFGNISKVGHPLEYFERFPGLIWSYDPSIEKRAANFSDYVCKKVINRPVTFGANPSDLNQPRKLGLFSTDDPLRPAIPLYKEVVKRNIQRCGGRFAMEQTSPRDGAQQVDDLGPNSQDDAAAMRQHDTQVMANFKTNNVTTIIWAGGYDSYASEAAAELSYRPEWIVSGDGMNESNINAKVHEKSVWQHAWVVATVTQVTKDEEQPCYVAYKEVDPNSQFSTPFWIVSFACDYYQSLMQMFTGVQVAGPRLNPTTMERGFRAIPHVASTSPKVPACFYEAGDYTCVKDAIAEWWDPYGPDPNPDILGPAGCWRMTEKGKRHLPGTWPSGDVLAQKTSEDQCNGWEEYYANV